MGIISALKELRRILYYSKLFDTFVNSLITFLFFSLIILSLRQSWKFAFIPALLYLVPKIFIDFKKIEFKDVEEKVPELEWQLRTVADNMNKENEVVRGLKNNVLEKISNVRTSYFLNNKKIITKLVAIATLSFMIVIVGLLNINLLHFDKITGLIPSIDKILGKSEKGGSIEGESPVEIKTDKQIYGEESIVPIGNEQLDIELNPEENGIDLGKINENEKREFKKKSELGDIGASADSSYEERIKKEHREIIKNYFENLRGNEEK